MRITGKNSAVTGLEDIVSKGGTLSIPTAARIHAIASASADDDTGGTGAITVEVTGINATYQEVREIVTLNGVASVNTTLSYLFINEMQVLTAGSGSVNAGIVSATAAVDGTVTCQIPAGENKSKQAIFMNSGSLNKRITFFSASTYNATGGAVTTLSFWKKAVSGVWTLENQIELEANHPTFFDENSGFFPEIGPHEYFKVMGQASAGSSAVNVNFVAE